MLTTEATSNIEAVLAEVQKALGAASGPSEHVLEIQNTADYAIYLDARLGISVVNDEVLSDAVHESLAERMEERNREGALLSDGDVIEGFEEAATVVIGHYQSVIGTTDSPGRVKLPPRPVHTGGFASDSELLIESFESQVDEGSVTKHPSPF